MLSNSEDVNMHNKTTDAHLWQLNKVNLAALEKCFPLTML